MVGNEAMFPISCFIEEKNSVTVLSMTWFVNVAWGPQVTLLFCGDPVNPALLLLGLCATIFFVSMWLHNVATAVMMMPVATGIVQRLPPAHEQSEAVNKFCRAVILTVVYATPIGGISTLTGTGVNLIIIGMWKSLFPEAKPISFNTWFFYGFPVAVLILICFWCIICLLYVPKGSGRALSAYLDRSHLKRDLEALGNFLTSTVFNFFFLSFNLNTNTMKPRAKKAFPGFRLVCFFVLLSFVLLTFTFCILVIYLFFRKKKKRFMLIWHVGHLSTSI